MASARWMVHTETLSTRHGLSDPPTTYRFQQPAWHHEVELVNIDPAKGKCRTRLKTHSKALSYFTVHALEVCNDANLRKYEILVLQQYTANLLRR